MKSFINLKKNLKKNSSNFKEIRVAILGDSATQLLIQALQGYAYERALYLNIFEADYNQIEREVFYEASELYQFKPEYILLFYSPQKLLEKFHKLKKEDRVSFADRQLEQLKNIIDTTVSKLGCKVICFNFPEINDAVFGNFANKVESSFLFQIRKLNLGLMQLSQKIKSLFICDLCVLQSQLGNSNLFEHKLYVNADMAFHIDALPHIAKNCTDIIQSVSGKFAKCVIFDLDNTIWGGIIGDDGVEGIQIGELGIGRAFTDLQLWLRELKNRGVILAVCSQNNEDIAKEPFQNHPDMVLHLDDIAVFVANHNSKAENIRYIQSILNIGFDSMVFLDDNPFERNLVRKHFPEIVVPELPKDPAEYLDFLRNNNYFETASFVELDEKRTKQYQSETKRKQIQESFSNEDDFLATLAMYSLIEPFNELDMARVAQLTQRSNQFNLRTVRYTEEEIAKIMVTKDFHTFAFHLRDKFGDNGLISLIILKHQGESLFIDTWIMSCRVLKRGMEALVLNELVEFANKNDYIQLVGEYLSTQKNGLVKNHYSNLGFYEEKGLWFLNTSGYIKKKHFIKRVDRPTYFAMGNGE